MLPPLLRTISIAGAALLAAVVASGAAAAAEPARELLPDLDQHAPSGLEIRHSPGPRGQRYSLGFDSAVRNIGDGPLMIEGGRASARTPTMTARQVIEREDGGRSTVANAGRLKYAVSSDHQHWHLLRFDRYELRPAGKSTPVVRDHKAGFCLGDRYRVVSIAVPAAALTPAYTSRCGLRQPGRLQMREGISVGYGDNYGGFLEGQSLPISGLPAGRYVLVHRVNGDRRLRELDYSNNAASLLLDLRWRRGRPDMRILASCPDSDRCDSPLGGAAASAAPHRSAPDPPLGICPLRSN